MRVKSESEVAQSCLTLGDPMDCSPPGSSVHGIFQAGVLEWDAIAFSGQSLVAGKWQSLNLAFLTLEESSGFSHFTISSDQLYYFFLWEPLQDYKVICYFSRIFFFQAKPFQFSSLPLKDKVLRSHHGDISPLFASYQVNNILFKV